MSTTEEKDQAVAEGEQEGKVKEQPGTWRFLIPLAAFAVGFVSHLFAGWVIFPPLLYSEKHQPIDFSHKIHQEAVDEGCESCHYFREDGSFSGIPKLENCVECHEEPMGDNREEAKLIKEYIEPGKEIPWLIYACQPQCVFFSHAAHVKGAEIDCTTCHGHIGESEHLRVYEENRFTGYSRNIWGKNMAGLKKNTWDRMKMDDCAECHKEATGKKTSVQTGKDACFVCHK